MSQLRRLLVKAKRQPLSWPLVFDVGSDCAQAVEGHAQVLRWQRGVDVEIGWETDHRKSSFPLGIASMRWAVSGIGVGRAITSEAISVAAGATLNLVGGTFTQLAGATIGGAGNVFVNGATSTLDFGTGFSGSVQIASGTISFNAPQTFTNLTLSNSGRLGGSGTVTVTGALTWTGGTMRGTGKTVLAAGATATLNNTSNNLGLDESRVFENAGTVTHNGNLIFNLHSFGTTTSRVVNFAGAVWESQGEADFRHNSSTNSVFENAGLFRKTGAGTTQFTASLVRLVNTGTVEVLGGTIALEGGFEQTTGSLALLGGNLSATGTLTFAGGSVLGTGTIIANVTNSGAVFAPSADGNRTIAITGSYSQLAGGSLELDLDSLAAGGAFDRLAVSGAASLNGTLTLRNSLALTNEIFTLLTHASRIGQFSTLSMANGVSAVPSYLATRSDFTVTADAPSAGAPQLAASYEEWVGSVHKTWGEPTPAAARGNDSGFSFAAASAVLPWDADPFADPDRDGSNNLLEYAFQTNPLNPGSTPHVTIGRDHVRQGRLILSCLRRANASDISMVLESSSDLKTWRGTGWIDEVDGRIVTKPVGPGIEQCDIDIDPSVSGGRFWRWNVLMKP